jgi:hypothetical protein
MSSQCIKELEYDTSNIYVVNIADGNGMYKYTTKRRVEYQWAWYVDISDLCTNLFLVDSSIAFMIPSNVLIVPVGMYLSASVQCHVA